MGEAGAGVGIIQGILHFITGLFGNDPGNVWGGIAGTSDIGFGSLNNSLGFLETVTSKLKGIFSTIWDSVVKVALVELLKAYQKLRELLGRIFGPVMRFLQRLRQLYDSYFNK